MTTSTTVAIRKLPEYEEKAKKDILAAARQLYDYNRQNYIPADIQMADLSAGEREAVKRAYAGIESYLPMMQLGSDTVGQGISAFGKGIDIAALGVPTTAASMMRYDPSSVSNYMNPYTEQVIKQTTTTKIKKTDCINRMK